LGGARSEAGQTEVRHRFQEGLLALQKATSGSTSMTWTSATRMAALVCRTRSHCAPTVCIHMPMLLTSTPSHIARNTPMFSGAQVDGDVPRLTS
jgi:hypothetical protein